MFDVLLKTRPNATTVALEAVIMWGNNKSSDWLDDKPQEQRTKYFEETRSNVKQIKLKMKARRQQILQERKKKMQYKMERKKQMRKRKASKG